jgi:hypothetical protein
MVCTIMKRQTENGESLKVFDSVERYAYTLCCRLVDKSTIVHAEKKLYGNLFTSKYQDIMLN